MFTNRKNSKIRSEFFSQEILEKIDDSNPKYSMFLIAHEIVKNCYAHKYQFRNTSMLHRLHKHGALPKSFFMQNFRRCSKLLELIELNGYSLLTLTNEIAESDFLTKINLFERKEDKTFYCLKVADNNEQV